ncbi:MAG TPA: dihydrofolate reductase family protein [Actinocrinis sp.]|jgi:dihydrofolate reductase|uniref:dihydrofolate reductase family protein n=1 Tax=Actinocrinis sp. TaxID=1920516 RepID=UPI002DDD2179|nr:dihydrofolate reductase family protein [Actinocrinis sp.]HEV3169781.1 dihydrofolate reductase family protein [Actinocrinis sp.]
MRKLSVSTLVSLDGIIQDPGGFGETEYGGWANTYFTDYAQAQALRHLQASDYFLIGRRTYELLNQAWGGIKDGAYLQRMNEIRKLVASTTLTGPLEWNATVIAGDVGTAVATLKQESGGDIEVYGSATLVQTLMRHDLIDEYRVAVHPIILGHGTRLFPQSGGSATLELASARTLDSGVVNLTYVRPGRG